MNFFKSSLFLISCTLILTFSCAKSKKTSISYVQIVTEKRDTFKFSATTPEINQTVVIWE